MADARQLEVWETYAAQCQQINRRPIIITKDNWFTQKLAQLPDVHNVLDIGCGPGNWANLFKDKIYIAFDQSPSMLELVNEYIPNALTVLGNARSLDKYFPKKFDMCFTSAVLQHNRHYPDKEEIVLGMKHILRPGGYYMCAENTFTPSNTPQYGTDGYSFTKDGWEKYMKSYGFALLDYKELYEPYEQAVPTHLYLYQKI